MKFQAKQPFKILRQATKQAAKINKYLDQYTGDFTDLKQLTSIQHQIVKLGIERQEKQNKNFKRISDEDSRKRNDIIEQLTYRTQNSIINKQKLIQLKQKSLKLKNQHVQKTFKRHQDDQKAQIRKQEQQAIKVRQERVKQIEIKLKNKINIKKPKRSYDEAMQRIRHRDSLIQQFAAATNNRIQKSFRNLQKTLNPELQQAKVQKEIRYRRVLSQKSKIVDLKIEDFVQKHCIHLQQAEKMVQKKNIQFQKMKKTIQQYNEHRAKAAKRNRQYIKQQQKVIPDKCQQRLNHNFEKSAQSTKTSSFMITCKTWRSQGKVKRNHFKNIQQKRDDAILQKHIETTFRNKGEDNILNKFLDLSRRASFNAKQLL